MPDASCRLIDVAALVIAEAEMNSDMHLRDEIVQAASQLGVDVRDPDGELVKLKPLLTKQWTETWWEATAAVLAVANPWFQLDDLAGGALHRRIDALYDRFDTPFCAHEVQSYFAEFVEAIIDAATGGSTKLLRSVAQLSVGAAGGAATAYGIPGMPVAMKAADWIERQGRTVTVVTFDLAMVAMVWSLLPQADDGLTSAEAQMLQNCQAESRATD